jgi:hypothetical protein
VKGGGEGARVLERYTASTSDIIVACMDSLHIIKLADEKKQQK